MAKQKVIAPEYKAPEVNLKRDYFYRNMTLPCLQEAFKHKQNLWHVNKLNMVEKLAIDEFWEDCEAELLMVKKPILEAAGYTYALEKVKK